MKLNDFQSMMHDLRTLWDQGWSPSEIAGNLVCMYFEDRYNKGQDMSGFAQAVKNTLRR